jgi:hypothetical protein
MTASGSNGIAPRSSISRTCRFEALERTISVHHVRAHDTTGPHHPDAPRPRTAARRLHRRIRRRPPVHRAQGRPCPVHEVEATAMGAEQDDGQVRCASHDLRHTADVGRPLGASRSAGTPRASRPRSDACDSHARDIRRPPDTLCTDLHGLRCGQNVVRQLAIAPRTSREIAGTPYTWRVPGGGRCWDRTSDLCRVRAYQGASLAWQNGGHVDIPRVSALNGTHRLASFLSETHPMRVLALATMGEPRP